MLNQVQAKNTDDCGGKTQNPNFLDLLCQAGF